MAHQPGENAKARCPPSCRREDGIDRPCYYWSHDGPRAGAGWTSESPRMGWRQTGRRTSRWVCLCRLEHKGPALCELEDERRPQTEATPGLRAGGSRQPMPVSTLRSTPSMPARRGNISEGALWAGASRAPIMSTKLTHGSRSNVVAAGPPREPEPAEGGAQMHRGRAQRPPKTFPARARTRSRA